MNNETMEQETQTAASETETPDTSAEASEVADDAGASETEASTENESQEQSQDEAPEESLGGNADDQPVTAPEGKTAAAAPQYATLEKENAELKSLLREVAELQKSEHQAKLAERAQKSTTPKGVWKEKLAKHFQGPDAAVLSEALEAALSERLGDVDSIKQDVGFMKPWLEQFGVEHELSKGANALVAEGVPQSVVAKLRPEVDAMLKSGIRAPAEFMYRAAYAKEAMKNKSAIATKTLQARTQTKPKAPAPKNTTPPASAEKYAVPSSITDPRERLAHLLKQFEK